MIRRLLRAAPALVRQADVRFTAVVLVLSVLALLFSGSLIDEPPIPLDRDMMAMSPRVFPYLILLGTVVVAAIFLGFRIREADPGRDIPAGPGDRAATRGANLR